MCQKYPAPRCSNHETMRMRKHAVTYQKTLQQYGQDNPHTLIAEEKLNDAIESYKSTPDGLKELEASNSPQLQHYRDVRAYQYDWNQEIKNGNMGLFAARLADRSGFTVPESEEILESSFRNSSPSNLSRLPETSEWENTQEQYGIADAETPSSLRVQQAYRSALDNAEIASNQMKREMNLIATIQNTTPEVAQKAFNAYKEQYRVFHLLHGDNSKMMPNPPDEWLNGDTSYTGYKNQNHSKFVPMTPENAYAIMRLRSDPNAIPDYLKTNPNIAAFNENNDCCVYNQKGRLLHQIPAARMAEQAENMRNSVIVGSHPKNFVTMLRNQDASIKTISLSEFSRTHFGLSSGNRRKVSEFFTDKPDADSAQLYLLAKKKLNKAWNSKVKRRNLPPADL